MSADRRQFSVAPARAILDPDLSATAKLVVAVMGCFTDITGICWPGYDALAKGSGLHRSTVIKAVAELERRGFVQKSARWDRQGDRDSNRYRVIFDAPPGVVAVGDYPVAKDDEGSRSGRPERSQGTEGTTTPPDRLSAPAVLARFPEQFREAVAEALTAARNPRALASELIARLEGMDTGKPVKAEDLGLALRNLLATEGVKLSPRLLDGYVRSVQAGEPPASARGRGSRRTTSAPADAGYDPSGNAGGLSRLTRKTG